jgi:hypothetical protein
MTARLARVLPEIAAWAGSLPDGIVALDPWLAPQQPTASLSGCRRSGSDSSITAVSWAYALTQRCSYLGMSCAYTRGPLRSRAVVGPTLGSEGLLIRNLVPYVG